MGLDLGRPLPRAARALVVGGLLVAALAGPASAEDPTPAPSPMSDPASTLAPPSQQQIDDARNALDRMRGPRQAAPTPPTTLTQVAAPVGGAGRGSVASRISDETWWTVGAALMVLLVLSETSRITVRRAKHRKEA